MNNFMPKRNFTSGFDRFLENMISKLPNGNVGYFIIFMNSFFYFLYLIWPRSEMYSFMNNFTFSRFNYSRGYLHTFFTSHFAHMSFLPYLLDTVILYLFCQNLTTFYGPLFVAKTLILSMFLANLLMFIQHSGRSIVRPYCGNDALLRGLIFAMIFQNPSSSFYLIPIPVAIPAWAIGAVLLGLDFLSFNVAAFGGVTSAYLMLNYF